MTSIADRASFEMVRYANCWEDADVLTAALDPQPGDLCLSIASGGDNSLSLLAYDPELVVAIDLSAAQIALVELKTRAIALMDRDPFLAFAGFSTPVVDRIEIYRSLRERLSPESRRYWDDRHETISDGIIHTGKFEHYFSFFRRWVVPLVHSRSMVAQLLAPKTAEERRRFYHEEWNTPRWRALFRFFFSRFVMGKLGRDPEFFRWVEGSVAEQILQRVSYALSEIDVGTNPFARYILEGTFGQAIPSYIRPEFYDRIRANIERLRPVHGEMATFLAGHARGNGVRRFDCFNLSDIFEYLDPPSFERLARTIVDHSADGARLAYWNMLAPRRISALLPDHVHWYQDRSDRLLKRDRAFFYRSFILEGIIPR